MSILGIMAALAAAAGTLAGDPDMREIRCPLPQKVADADGKTRLVPAFTEIERQPTCAMVPSQRQMSLRPILSCPRVERLPRCPRNFYLFREYTEDELAKIDRLLDTAAYRRHANASPYYLAHLVEKALDDGTRGVRTFVPLWFGTWFDAPSRTWRNVTYKAAYLDAADEAFKDGVTDADDVDPDMLKAVAAYGYLEFRQPAKARMLLNELIEDGFGAPIEFTAPAPAPPDRYRISVYDRWMTMMDACLDRKLWATCSPGDPIPSRAALAEHTP